MKRDKEEEEAALSTERLANSEAGVEGGWFFVIKVVGFSIDKHSGEEVRGKS
jgi:hypothetical protein